MEGSAAPLGAERRRLAPLTGPTVWGSATPRRSSPLSKGGRARPRRGGRTQPPYLCASKDFHSPRSPDLAAPPPPRVKIPARPGRANRKSAAERCPPPPERKRRRRWRRRPGRPGAREAWTRVPRASRPGWDWLSTCRPPAGRAGLGCAGRASQAQVSEGLRSALPPPPFSLPHLESPLNDVATRQLEKRV